MKSRNFIVSVVVSVVLIIGIIAGFNYYTNPFGVVKETGLNWSSYNFTENPRTAKITYLDNNYTDYNSYIIGSSGASAFPTDTLDHYNNKKNYNLFYYGADMYDSLNTVNYIIEKYNVDEILLPISFSSTVNYHTVDDDLNYTMDYQVEKTSPIKFWTRYLLANPQFGMDKIEASKEDSYFQKKFDVFIPNSGLYDKRLRDVEYIGSKEDYLKNFPAFQQMTIVPQTMTYLDDAIKAITDIKTLCDKNNVKLTVVLYPLLEETFRSYREEDVNRFYEELAEITGFWDFTYSSISKDPRYFYDPAHFRNDVGRMMLAKIYGDTKNYVFSDFGYYVKQDEVRRYNEIISLSEDSLNSTTSYTANIPVLLLHHIDSEPKNSAIITKEKLTSVLSYIKDAGYTTITYDDLYDYVTYGTPLPEKPIMLTFDDGYKSNYAILYPILKENNQKATISIIGSSIGKNTYKNTNISIYEHFTYAEAKEMLESGFIKIASHTYDMHQSAALEENKDHAQTSMLRLEGDTEDVYIKSIKDDFEKFRHEFSLISDEDVKVLAYPLGEYDKYLTSLLNELGIKCTFTTKVGNNTIIKGLPQTLYNLRRNAVDESTDIEELIRVLESEK